MESDNILLRVARSIRLVPPVAEAGFRPSLRLLAVSSVAINLFALTIPIVMLITMDRILPFRAMDTLVLLMIGAALVLFFLLLLSLAEHLAFGAAYALASAACIGLLAYYLRHVLGGWRAALVMSSLLVALYGVLYSILLSEDNALLLGSLLLFGVLATVMTVTRRIDWYHVLPTDAEGSGTKAR